MRFVITEKQSKGLHAKRKYIHMSVAALKEKVNSTSLKGLKSFGILPNGTYIATASKRLADDEGEGVTAEGKEWSRWETPVVFNVTEVADYNPPEDDEWSDFSEMFGSNPDVTVKINRDPQWSMIHDQLVSAVGGIDHDSFEEAIDEAISDKTPVQLTVKTTDKTRADGTPITNFYFNPVRD